MIIKPHFKREKEDGLRVESDGMPAHTGAPLNNINCLEGSALQGYSESLILGLLYFSMSKTRSSE